MTAPPRFDAAAAWGAAPFEPLARLSEPVHEALLDEVAPAAGERLLDVACGTGAIALRAAAAGAVTTGLDIASGMLATARERAAAAGLDARFDLGDATSLPYRDASVDVVLSSQGVVFAQPHARAARELARVCATGGRLGLSMPALTPENFAFFGLWERFIGGATGDGPLAWGRPDYVRRLLGSFFSLRFVHVEAPVIASSAEELWRLHRDHCGPLKLLADRLPAAGEAALRRGFLDHFRRYEDGDQVRAPRTFLLALGVRR